ncbi:MAG: NAD(P)H-binding protein [Planctomycetota bacterium]|nr:NAD(P)H-binding protein [Planctomycetota bacterium]
MIAILGAGHIALRLIPKLCKTHEVRGSTRNPERLTHIRNAGAQAMIADLGDRQSLAAFLSGVNVVVFSVAPRRTGYAEVYGAGLSLFLDVLTEQSPKARVILITSTAVYDGLNLGELVHENTPAKPQSERSEWLHKAERALRGALAYRAQILRLAGLYSKSRGPFNYVANSLKEQTPLRDNGSKLLNLIHEDDAVSVLLEMIHRPELQLVLGADGNALTRAQAYGLFARSEGYPEPRFQRASAALSGRDCRPKQLPISLRFPSFGEALEQEWD